MRLRSADLLASFRGALALALLLGVAACGTGRSASGPSGAQEGTRLIVGQLPSGLEPIVDGVPSPFGFLLDTIRAGAFDQGRLWTFDDPPLTYFLETYGFTPDGAWLEQARMASLRIPGCSASFVSQSGLVVTNHHCIRGALTKATRDGENLLEDGFYARSLQDERPLEDFHADQLIAIVDVSEEVARRIALTPASLLAQRRGEIHRDVAQRVAAEHGGPSPDLVVEVVTSYAGARTSAYTFRRHRDVRLVMVPELDVAFFGGEPDNFSFPRHALDFAFLRVYGDGGEPLPSMSYFRWSADGASEGELTFLIGNPGSTNRGETVEQLTFRRDVSDRSAYEFIRRRAQTFTEFAQAHPDQMRAFDLEEAYFNLLNTRKSYEGHLLGLHEPAILARLEDRDARVKQSIEADSVLKRDYGDDFERMAELQTRKRNVGGGFAFLGLNSAAYESATLHRALMAYQYGNALRQAQPIAIREQLREQMLAIRDQPAELDEALMQDRFQGFLDVDTTFARVVLQGRSPEGQAAFVRENSIFTDSAQSAAALASGSFPADDPALRVVQSYMPSLSRFEQMRIPLLAQEQSLSERIARARYEVLGTSVPPEATGSLRLADGVVQGTDSGAGRVPPFTTFRGMLEQYRSNQGRFARPSDSPWNLPERWRTPPADFAMDTPLNFVTTADILGGHSGSPIVSRDLAFLGVAFDGNEASRAGSYIYLPSVSRTVAVDARGIAEALRAVYGMEGLLLELSGGRYTEARAATPNE